MWIYHKYRAMQSSNWHKTGTSKDEAQKIRQKKGSLRKKSELPTINPFMDKHGIIRNGGRIKRSRRTSILV